MDEIEPNAGSGVPGAENHVLLVPFNRLNTIAPINLRKTLQFTSIERILQEYLCALVAWCRTDIVYTRNH